MVCLINCWVMVLPPWTESLVRLWTTAPKNRFRVDPVVGPETHVLDGDECLLEHLRDLRAIDTESRFSKP